MEKNPGTPALDTEPRVDVRPRGSGFRVNLPLSVAASLLAVTTVLISLPPTNFPPWAIFIGWAGTFAAGGPSLDVIKKISPTMPVGSLTAFVIVLGFNAASHYFTGWSFTAAQMVILFCLNAAQIVLSQHVRALAFVPGMFFGFASYFATYFGGFGPLAHNAVVALGAVVLMNALGPLYAWLNVKLMAPGGEH